MDNSTVQMCTARYNVSLTEDFDALLGYLCFDQKFKGLRSEENRAVFHLGQVEVIRTKSNGDITIRGGELGVLALKVLFEINAPNLEGRLGDNLLTLEPFGVKTNRRYEGNPTNTPPSQENRYIIRTFKKRVDFFVGNWLLREEAEPTMELLQFKHGIMGFVRELDPF